MRMEERRAEVWYSAMLPRMKKPPEFHDFVSGKKDKRSEIIQCIDAWDKIDMALAESN